MGKNIKIKEAEFLLERYYEGLTTVAEEHQLHNFLSRKNLPGRFDADKTLFKYFAKQKTQNKTNVISFVRWASIAAAFLAFVFVTEHMFSQNKNDYAYIDGKRFTDVSIIKEKALLSIGDLTELQDEVKTGASLLKDNDNLIDQQLGFFAEMN